VQERLDWKLPLVLAAGTLFKETFVLWALCLTIALYGVQVLGAKVRREDGFYLGLALAAAVLVNQFCLAAFPQVQSHTFATIATWTTVRLTDAFSLMRYIAAALAALGPFLILFLTAQIGGGTPQPPRAVWLLAATGLYAGASFVSGSDLTKFVFQSAPILLPLIFMREEEVRPGSFWLLLGLVLAWLPFAHVAEAIPSPIVGREVPNQDYDGPYAWMMEYAHLSLVGATLAWGALLALAAAVYRLRTHNCA
jgi:hypothetical protein